jgi:hypothetical protein
MHQYFINNAADRATSGTTPITMLILSSPSTRRFKIKEIWCTWNSVTATDIPGLVELMRYTNAGTSTAYTPVPVDSLDPAALTTAGELCSVEPTGPTTLMSFKVSPIGTTLIYQAPLGDEFTAKVSDFIGLRLTTGQTETGIRLSMKIQE